VVGGSLTHGYGTYDSFWYGTVSTGTVQNPSTASTTVTLTWSATNSTYTEVTVQEFPPALGASGYNTSASWALVTGATQFNASSTTMSTPSLTTTAANQLAWFAMLPTNAGSGGSPSSFTFEVTAYSTVIGYNYNTANATAYSPTATTTPAGSSIGLGGIFEYST